MLVTPLIWARFEPSMMAEVLNEFYRTVCGKICAINLHVNFEAGENPIQRVELIPSQTDGNVDLDEISLEEAEIPVGGGSTFKRNKHYYGINM